MFPDTTVKLTQEQIDALKEAKANIPKIRREITKARAAGVPLDDQMAQLDESERQINQLLNAYAGYTGSTKPSK